MLWIITSKRTTRKITVIKSVLFNFDVQCRSGHNSHAINVKIEDHIVPMLGTKDLLLSLDYSMDFNIGDEYKMPCLSEANRHIAIDLLQAGQSQGFVAWRINVHQSTISRLLERYRQQNTAADIPCSGRPRATIAAQERYIRVRLRHWTVTVTRALQKVPRVRKQTTSKRLREFWMSTLVTRGIELSAT